MSVFERYLTVWVFLCIVVGIVLGQLLPGPEHVGSSISGVTHGHILLALAIRAHSLLTHLAQSPGLVSAKLS